MRKQLEELFGCAVNIKEYTEKLSLPIYMMRHISIVELFGTSFARRTLWTLGSKNRADVSNCSCGSKELLERI